MIAALIAALAALAPFHPFTTSDDNLACPQWRDPSSGMTTRNCDPVNLVFPGQSLAGVRARLATVGWTDGAGSVQRLRIGTLWVPVPLQLAFSEDAAHRFHVRLWQVGDTVVGNVHHEYGSEQHTLDLPWEASEQFVANQLCSTWCELLPVPDQLELQQGFGWRGLANDGRATVIPIVAPAEPQPMPRRHRFRPPTRSRP